MKLLKNFLLTTNVVRGKVMFYKASAIPFRGLNQMVHDLREGGGWGGSGGP